MHIGHLAIARAARDQAHLDRVLFVIAANPPHKQDTATPASMRLAMAEAAIADDPDFELSRLELERPGPSYTADTLARLKTLYPEAALFFIAGYDSALDLPHWRKPESLLEQASLLVAPRPENSRPLPAMLEGRCRLLRMDDCPISSSEIRARIGQGENMDVWLPPPVAAMIRDKGLYHADSQNAAI
jgi:nicotinate-nucleotide adenylyltransferase